MPGAVPGDYMNTFADSSPSPAQGGASNILNGQM